jgi:uncharacterized membrane protein YphA (DoxX/SURF4 family)
MSKVALVARILLGLVFFVFGLNGFFQFLTPPPMEGKSAEFLGALLKAGYFFPFLKTFEVLCGILLLSGYFVPLALVILAPININIFLFHVFLDKPFAWVMSFVFIVLHVVLAYAYKESYREILKPKP